MTIARPKRKRRRVDISLRIEEARASVTVLDDLLALLRDVGEDQSGDWYQTVVRVRNKIRTGLDYVTQTQGDR